LIGLPRVRRSEAKRGTSIGTEHSLWLSGEGGTWHAALSSVLPRHQRPLPSPVGSKNPLKLFSPTRCTQKNSITDWWWAVRTQQFSVRSGRVRPPVMSSPWTHAPCHWLRSASRFSPIADR
jgi:hypothetical protein